MKNLMIITLILLGLGSVQISNAQTSTEKKLKEIKARKTIAKAMVEDGNLNTMEREAEVGEDPCTLYDDSEWYTAFNQKEGRRGDPKLATALLQQCKLLLQEKIGGAYKRVTKDYFDQMDVDTQSAAVSHIESAGEMTVEKILNDVLTYCQKTSNPDDRGNIIMYMGIRISKQEIIDKVVKELSKDKELGVRFNEEKFRESAFKVFDMDK